MLSESHTSFVYTMLSFVLYLSLFIASLFEKPKQIEINIPSKLKLEEVKLNFEKKTLFEEQKITFDNRIFKNPKNLMCTKIKPKDIKTQYLLLDKLKRDSLDLNNKTKDIKSRVRIKKASEKALHEIDSKKKL